jgi:hypothetical protein
MLVTQLKGSIVIKYLQADDMTVLVWDAACPA